MLPEIESKSLPDDPSPPRHKHIPALQSVRGLAALVVLLNHALFVFATSPGFRYGSEAALNAHAAVVLFFVLSGYVLSRSLSGAHISIDVCWRFYVRRGFRVYPAALLSVMAGLAYVLTIREHFATPNVSHWFIAEYTGVKFDLKSVIQNITILKSSYMPIMGTIKIEIEGSILLPFLWMLTKGPRGIFLLLFTGAICVGVGRINPMLEYGFSFALGAWCFRHGQTLADWARKPWFGLIALVVLLFFRRINSGWNFETDYTAPLPTAVETLAAGALILFVVNAKAGVAWLEAKPIVALGDVSYSIYLFHFPIMSALSTWLVFDLLPVDGSALLLAPMTLGLTALLSWVTYRYVELPGIAAGRAFLDRAVRLRVKPEVS